MTNTDWMAEFERLITSYGNFRHAEGFSRARSEGIEENLNGEYARKKIKEVLHHASTLPAAPGAAPSLPEDQPSGRTYKDVDELFSAMGIPPSSGGSDEQIARRLVAWDDSGNTQGEHHETLREIINSARAALQAPSPEAGESEPSRRRVVHKKTCVAVVEDGEVIGTFAGPDCERHAAEFAALPAQPQPSGDRQEGNQQ